MRPCRRGPAGIVRYAWRVSDAQTAPEPRLVLPSRLAARGAARRLWLWVVLLVVVAGGTVAYFRWPRSGNEAVYRTSPLERRTIARVVEATGEVDVESRVEVVPPGTGSVAELMVRAGESVTQNQTLATLNPAAANAATREAAAGVGAAQSRVAAAQTELDLAVERRKRAEDLFKDHFIKRAELDAARGAEERAQASLQAAKAERDVTSQKLASAKEAQKTLTLRAPVDGIVLVAPQAVGVATSPEKGALFVIGSSLAVMHVRASVAEADIGVIQPGQKAEITVPAYPGKVFHGAVERIAIEPERDTTVVSYPVTFRVENPDLKLRPGMSADVRIFVAEARDVLAVREGALRFSPDGEGTGSRSRIWVSRDGVTLEAVDVTPGLSDGAYTQIESKGSVKVAPGDPVAVGFLRPEAAVESTPGISLGKR